MRIVVEEDDYKAWILSLLKVLACSKQEYVGTGHDDVPDTGHDDVLVLWADAIVLGTGHDDVRSYV